MRVYLVQHGKATDEKKNPERPLTIEGIAESKRAAELAAQAGTVKPVVIFHSGKLRAYQTAEIFYEVLKPPKGVKKADSINPNDDIFVAVEAIKSETEDIMIIGHLPHLSKTVSKLITGDENKQIVAFKNSCIICLEKLPDSTWVITPVIQF